MIDYHGLDIDKCYISGCQCGKPKADDLRTRIAAVVSERYRNDPTNDVEGWAANLADAVIRELGLRQVTDVNRSVPQSRYVTGWEDDE